jgi:hypothetical protein
LPTSFTSPAVKTGRTSTTPPAGRCCAVRARAITGLSPVSPTNLLTDGVERGERVEGFDLAALRFGFWTSTATFSSRSLILTAWFST